MIFSVFFVWKTGTVHAAQDDSLFNEIYLTRSEVGITGIYRIKLADSTNHLYVVSSYQILPGNTKGIRFASEDIYSFHTINSGVWSIQGVLKSETSQISSFRSLINPYADISYSSDEISCLPEGVDIQNYYTHANGIPDKTVIKTQDSGENIFSVDFDAKNKILNTGMVCQLEVEDQGEKILCTIIFQKKNIDYDAFGEEGLWNKWEGENQELDWSNYGDTIKLYNGTDGKAVQLDEKYQYGSKIRWQSDDYDSGLTDDGDLLDYSEISLPSDVKSIRVSYENPLPESKQAIFLGMPGNIYQQKTGLGRNTLWHNYLYYRNKTHMVSINGGEWYDMKEGEPSPELELKKGLNVIYIAGTDTKTRECGKSFSTYESSMSGYVIFVYSDIKDDYEVKASDDTALKEIELYQAGSDENDANDRFGKIEIKETEDKSSNEAVKCIDMNSAFPYIWINTVTNDPAAKVKVDGSTDYLGGLFKRLDSNQDYFDIEVTASNGVKKRNERIYINWTLSSAELQDLTVLSGGTMEEKYDPEVKSYYCKRSSSGKIVLSYTTSENTRTEVYVDRQKKSTIDGKETKSLVVNGDTKEVQWAILSETGKKVRFKIYFDRDRTETISDETKNRAKEMIDMMLAGGYKKYLTEQKGIDYWKTFGAAALGEEYLEDMLGFDVTTKEFHQATDYAAVILELVISGENPYDYLGVNYVDGLMTFNDNGNFGDYSANIWSLSALQAAGAEIPENTIEIVKRQALSETFDLDMRGWALYAISPYVDTFTDKEYARCIASIKETEIQDEIAVNGFSVTGCFENSYYTNRNVMSHACMVTGLTALGIDLGSGEFDGENGKDPVSILEDYQMANGGWIYTPDNPVGGGWNKDAVIAVGDLYNGSNVYTRYYLTEDRYKDLVSDAEQLLNGTIIDDTKRTLLQSAYDQAKKYLSEGDSLSIHGTEYYALQEAMYAVDKNVKPGVFLGTAEEREKVENVIKKIDTISSYSYADKEKLDGIKDAYDALKEDRLLHYVTNADVLDKAYNYVESIDTFISSANKLTNINLSKTAKVQKARQLYDSLDERQKSEEVVKKAYENLVKAEKKIDAAKTADAVTQAITYLGEIITLDSAEDIESVRAAYESLTEEQQTFVTNLDKLEAAEEKIRNLSIQQKNLESAEKVSDLIKQIGTVNQNSEAYIKAAREAYNALEEEVRYMVDNYCILLEAEKMYNNLKLRRDLDGVIEMAAYKISKIYDSYNGEELVTENNKDSISQAITEAKEYIESQTEKWPYIKSLVAEYPELMDMEAELSAYSYSGSETATLEGFISSVGEIGEIDNITLDAQSAIQKAEYLWDHLSTEDQANESVQNEYQTFFKAREELNSIRSCFNDIQELIYKVLSIGDVSLEENEYFEAETVYETLSDDVKKRVPKEIVEMLGNDSESYKSLSEKKEEVDIVIKKIEKAFMVVDLSEEAIVKDARNAYDVLEYKEYVTNYTDLLASEETILSLKKTVEDQGFADEIIKQIDTLTFVSKSDAEKVEAIRRAYDALIDRQKALVANLSLLEKAESVIAASDNEKSTESIPTNAVAIGENDSSASTATNVSNKTIVMNKKTTKATVYITGKKTKYTLSLVVNGKAISSKKVKWKSSKKTVATVSSKGIVTLKKKGSSTITATYKGKKYTCKLTVKKATFRLEKTKATIKKGGTITIKTTAIPKGTITYKTLNAKIATVTKNGKVTGKKIGKTRIKVVCNGITKYFTVTIK